jgi:hypothetical protein
MAKCPSFVDVGLGGSGLITLQCVPECPREGHLVFDQLTPYISDHSVKR